MKLSTKGRYGLRAIIDLARYSEEEPVSISSIAARQDISERYLEQLVALLKKAGLVKSIRGASGGYVLNKKVKRLALLSALSSKAQSGDIIVIDELKAAEYKTKTVVNMLTAIGADKKALIVTPAVDAKLVKSAANIPGVKTATADSINTYEVLNGGKFVISVDAAKKLEEVFA